jgi:hypothetical protein
MKRYLTTLKLIVAVIAINVLCLSPLALKAQDPNCGIYGDSNPYDTCPLDTWVWVLAAVVVVFVVVKMNRKAAQTAYKTV